MKNMEKTANQWKKLGFVLKDGAVGVERTQQFGSRYTYYTENDVRPLTEEEKLQIKEKQREERRLHRILLKAYKDYERFPEDLKNDLPLYFDERFYKNRYLPFKEKQKEVKALIEEALQKGAVPCSNPSRMIVIDIETTGFNEYHDDVLQISIIDGDGNILFNSYVKPYYNSYWLKEAGLCYIPPEMVVDAPELHELIPQLKGILDSCDTVVGYNTGFVISFLNFLDYSDKKEEDVMEDFAPIYGEWLPSFEAHKWQTLGTCAEYYGYNWNSVENSAGSLRDCYAILHCYRALKEEMKTMMNMYKWEK